MRCTNYRTMLFNDYGTGKNDFLADFLLLIINDEVLFNSTIKFSYPIQKIFSLF